MTLRKFILHKGLEYPSLSEALGSNNPKTEGKPLGKVSQIPRFQGKSHRIYAIWLTQTTKKMYLNQYGKKRESKKNSKPPNKFPIQ